MKKLSELKVKEDYTVILGDKDGKSAIKFGAMEPDAIMMKEVDGKMEPMGEELPQTENRFKLSAVGKNGEKDIDE